MKTSLELLIGQRFTKIVITGVVKHGKNQKWHLTYVCDCGKTGITQKFPLMNGRTKSCGCISHALVGELRLANRRIAKGESGLNSMYGQLKRNAKRRGIDFELTKDQVREICTKNCFYCEIPPFKKFTPSGSSYTKEGLEHSQFIYNGIDRVDNNIGYLKDNCVPCCVICNKLKYTHNVKDWFKYMEILVNKKEEIFRKLNDK